MQLDTPSLGDFEDFVYRTYDNIRVMAAVHSTRLGPALGGCRLKTYKSYDEQYTDTLRLAEGMSYKNAFAGTGLGGGKTTVHLPEGMDPTDDKVIDAIVDVVESLSGKYYTAKDMGFTSELLEALSRRTKYVKGSVAGDPSEMTAWGVYYGIEACLEYLNIEHPERAYNNFSRRSVKVGVEGLGGVGHRLTKILYERGFELVVYDINNDAYKRLTNDGILKYDISPHLRYEDLDIYCPCALGGTIDDTYYDIGAKAIAGSANNQIANKDISYKLFKSGKIYAPDFVINAGGVIHVGQELKTKNKENMYWNAKKQCQNIKTSLLEIFQASANLNMPTDEVAIKMAQSKLNDV